MAVALEVLRGIVGVFLLFLLFRLVISYVFMFARDWRPSGWVAVLLEITYSVTDPPYKALRRVIPPLRIGSVALDLAFTILIFVTFIVFTAL